MYRGDYKPFVLESKENIAENMASFSLKVRKRDELYSYIMNGDHMASTYFFDFVPLFSALEPSTASARHQYIFARENAHFFSLISFLGCHRRVRSRSSVYFLEFFRFDFSLFSFVRFRFQLFFISRKRNNRPNG